METPKLINHTNLIYNLYELKLDSFKDERGQNFEILDLDYSRCGNSFSNIYDEIGVDFRRSLISASISKKNVIRGGHGQTEGYKLVSCPLGEVQFFVVDVNPMSPTYNKYAEFILNEDNQRQFILPPYSLNFHGCLSDKCIFQYFWEEGYVEQANQLHGKWNDPKYSLPWLIKDPILSDRDK